jgi:hypothetical protein
MDKSEADFVDAFLLNFEFVAKMLPKTEKKKTPTILLFDY